MHTMALAHEWLAQRAGSEKTFERMARCFPHADLFALTRTAGIDFDLGGRTLRTSFLDRPLLRDRRAVCLPLMPLAWQTIESRRYPVVITSTHSFGRYFRPARHGLHLNYCYAPMRYAWTPEVDRRGRALVRGLGAAARPLLRRMDRASLAWTDHIAVISTAVAQRVEDYYERDSTVIPPPVDIDFYSSAHSSDRADHALAVSRFIPYKRIDLAIRAAAVAGVKLVVAGSGPGERSLRRLADEIHPHGVTFTIAPSDEELREMYARAAVVVFPAVEDFGIVPVEAQATGTPVVAPRAGGTMDTIVDGHTGILLEDISPASIAVGIHAALAMGDISTACRHNARRFNARAFDVRFREWVVSTTKTRETSTPAGRSRVARAI